MTLRAALIVAVGLGLLATPLGAQPAGKIWRIGVLQTAPPKDEADNQAALEQGLAELGYWRGRNVQNGHSQRGGQQVGRLPELAAELVRSGVDVIVTSVDAATLAAKQATTTIPIVMVVGVEPVAAGLVTSLAKPGANVTGLTFDVDATQIAAKRLEILKELIPSATRVAVLGNFGFGPGMLRRRGTEEAGRKLGVTIVSVEISEGGDIERAFLEIRRASAEAIIVLPDPVTVERRAEITGLAARHRVPAIYAVHWFVEAGGLISYATSLNDQWRRAARYVDKVLKGTKPADLPVEQPTKFELVINLKTAKTLGLTIPCGRIG